LPIYEKKCVKNEKPLPAVGLARVFSLAVVSLGSKGIIQADPWIQKVVLLVRLIEGGVSLDIIENTFDIDVQGRVG
jgi:hypothetical protein